MLSQEELRRLFIYDPSTGELVWRRRAASEFATDNAFKIWNARSAGTVAGTLDASWGYINIKIEGVPVRAHRIIWLMVHGEEPAMVDHINGDPADNRLTNLRASDGFGNMRNQRRHKPREFPMGVRKTPNGKKWFAHIAGDKARVHLGTFKHFHEAVAIRKCAEIALGYDVNHGKIHPVKAGA